MIPFVYLSLSFQTGNQSIFFSRSFSVLANDYPIKCFQYNYMGLSGLSLSQGCYNGYMVSITKNPYGLGLTSHLKKTVVNVETSPLKFTTGSFFLQDDLQSRHEEVGWSSAQCGYAALIHWLF